MYYFLGKIRGLYFEQRFARSPKIWFDFIVFQRRGVWVVWESLGFFGKNLYFCYRHKVISLATAKTNMYFK